MVAQVHHQPTRKPSSHSQLTGQVSPTMSCTSVPNTKSSAIVPVERYNSVLAQLESEVIARAKVEAEFRAARSRMEYLERRLAEFTSTHSAPSSSPTEGYTEVGTTTTTEAVVSGMPATSYAPDGHSAPSSQQPQSSSTQEKEILSHCSDISNCKGGASISKSPNDSHRAPQKKPPSTANGGITKKGAKAKKERNTKVKVAGQSRYWTPEEHRLFLEALREFGHKDLRSISAHVGTRNMTQVRTHSQKYFMRLMREAKRQNPSSKSGEASSEKTFDVNTVIGNAVEDNHHVQQQPQQQMNVTQAEENDKYSVPNTCGMTLLCLVGEDTRV